MDLIQYFFVSIVVIFVIVWQWKTFRENQARIKSINNLFPENDDTVIVYSENNENEEEDSDDEEGEYIYIENDNASEEFKTTLDDLNSYLIYNSNKTYDYQILKEIVNRNSKSLEDEVDVMLTVPLYLGLIATIFGIAFGIGVFAWCEIDNLLGAAGAISSNGIKMLLTDVAIAMIASLAGVFFTKQSTSSFNTAKTNMSRNKNRFLTWIQTDLMSKLSDDLSGALVKMTQDLNKFNRTFSKNTQELKATLSTVRDNYDGQVKLLNAIEKIKINKIAQANIEVYDRLQGCTEELEKLFTIISNSEQYVSKVVELNNNIGSVEERTRLFEELGQYFKNEIEFVRDRQGMMRQQMSSIDSVLQESLNNLGGSFSTSIENLTQRFQQQNERIELLINEQQNALMRNLETQQSTVNDKIAQIEDPFANLKVMFDEGIKGIKSALEEQNLAIKEALSSQKSTLESALAQQQLAIIKKLQETPGQLQGIADLAKVLDKLNRSLENIKFPDPTTGSSEGFKKRRGIWGYIKSAFVPVCMFGTFVTLAALLALQIMELLSK